MSTAAAAPLQPSNLDDLSKLIDEISIEAPSTLSASAAPAASPSLPAGGAEPSAFSALDDMLGAFEDGRMSLAPGVVKPQMVPAAMQSQNVPVVGPAVGAAGRGISGGRGISSGPGPGRGVSAGPGRGTVSSGPGAAWAARKAPAAGEGVEINMAQTTPDGRTIVAKGPPCAVCSKMILGRVINALGHTYHRECFRCKKCDQVFKGTEFAEYEGDAWCDPCYRNHIAPKCCKCSLPVKDRVVNWNNKTYHPEHFSCVGCGCTLTGGKLKEWDEEPYCLACFKERERWIQPAAHMCARCKKPIFGEYLKITGEYFHPEHFKCEACGCDLFNGNCHEYDNKLYCEEDYKKLLKLVCFGCRKPIAGRSITALGRVWHPEHLVCAMCFTPFPDSNFFEHEGKPYCRDDYAKHFAQVCNKCELPIIGTAFFSLGRYWHQEHYVCHYCDKSLVGVDQVLEWEGKPMCRACYFKLPKAVRDKYEKQKRAAAEAAQRREKHETEDRKREEKEMAKARKLEQQQQQQQQQQQAKK